VEHVGEFGERFGRSRLASVFDLADVALIDARAFGEFGLGEAAPATQRLQA
jgi:hypothetical protein